ncbi:MAG: hypothetical protein ACMUJM_04860 [bacterium]
MSSRKMIWVVCAVLLVASIFFLRKTSLNQILPWSWTPGEPFPVIDQIPLSALPSPEIFPTTGLPYSSGYPAYSPPSSLIRGCPVGLVYGLTLEEEFGPTAPAITRCLSIRNNIRVIARLNKLEYTPGVSITRPLTTMIDDYAITNGTRDFQLVALVHSGGLPLVLNRNIPAPHPDAIYNVDQPIVEDLIMKGVKFYL